MVRGGGGDGRPCEGPLSWRNLGWPWTSASGLHESTESNRLALALLWPQDWPHVSGEGTGRCSPCGLGCCLNAVKSLTHLLLLSTGEENGVVILA